MGGKDKKEKVGGGCGCPAFFISLAYTIAFGIFSFDNPDALASGDAGNYANIQCCAKDVPYGDDAAANALNEDLKPVDPSQCGAAGVTNVGEVWSMVFMAMFICYVILTLISF